jgi:hypothetical protein
MTPTRGYFDTAREYFDTAGRWPTIEIPCWPIVEHLPSYRNTLTTRRRDDATA